MFLKQLEVHMSFKTDGLEILYNGEQYKFVKKHRIFNNSDASIWTCSFLDEFDLVNKSLQCQYIENKKVPQTFNLKKGLPVLGKNNINSELKLAKFINSTQKLWHGYPADHVKNNQDRPTLDILTKMHTNGLITTKQMRKISKGQKV